MTGIPNYFQQDNFTARRSGAGAENFGVAYDPESLLTGSEVAAGLTYRDKRVWPDADTYKAAVAGKLDASLIPSIAPRVRIAATNERLNALLNASGLSPFSSGSAFAL